MSPKAIETVTKGRETVRNILDGKDKRLLMVIGPCSIHDVNAAHEYADKLLALSKEIEDSILCGDACFENPVPRWAGKA